MKAFIKYSGLVILSVILSVILYNVLYGLLSGFFIFCYKAQVPFYDALMQLPIVVKLIPPPFIAAVLTGYFIFKIGKALNLRRAKLLGIILFLLLLPLLFIISFFGAVLGNL